MKKLLLALFLTLILISFIGGVSALNYNNFNIEPEFHPLVTVTKSSNYTATTSDSLINVNAATGTITITLPSISSVEDAGYITKSFKIKKTDTTHNIVSVIPASGNTIEDVSAYVVTKRNDFITLYNDSATNWRVDYADDILDTDVTTGQVTAGGDFVVNGDLIINGLSIDGDSTLSDLNDAVSDIGSTTTTLAITTVATMSGNLTIPANITLFIAHGGLIDCNSTYTLTINGYFDAGLYKVFTNCDGLIIFGAGLITKVYPQWFGAVGDDSTDDTTAFTNAIASLPSDGEGITFVIPHGTYKCTSNLSIAKNNVRIVSDGILKFYDMSGPAVTLGSSTTNIYSITGNLIVKGSGSLAGSIGILIENLIQSNIHLYSRDFETAIKEYASGSRCSCYNQYHLEFVSGTTYGLLIDKDGAGSGVNENVHYGGRFGSGAGGTSLKITADMNNNRFIAPSFEGTPARHCDIDGQHNQLIFPRFEGVPTTEYVLFGANSTDNVWLFGHGDYTASLNYTDTTGTNHTFISGRFPELQYRVAVSAYRNAVQTLLINTWTKVAFNAETFDLGSDFDTTTNTFTAPVTGYYRVSSQVAFVAGIANSKYGIVLRNGATDLAYKDIIAAANGTFFVSLESLIFLTKNDLVTMYANRVTEAGDISGVTEYTFFTINLVNV